MSALKLMCVLAHPDDESLGLAGTLIKYAREGIETYLITATRGERGWFGPKEENPGLEALGKIRTAELIAAARKLGLQSVSFLDYIDGDLDQADPAHAIGKIVAEIRRVRPQVVITFDPNGDYGHPDHIAISQFTMAAMVAAADLSFTVDCPWPPHRVSKLYYRVPTKAEEVAYESAFGELAMTIDGVRRKSVAWEDWAITTAIDTAAYGQQIWQAIRCHRSQLPGYEKLLALSPEMQQALWSSDTYYRAYSLVNGGRKLEDDLFEGVR